MANTGPARPEQRYAWLNFEMEMIDIGGDDLKDV